MRPRTHDEVEDEIRRLERLAGNAMDPAGEIGFDGWHRNIAQAMRWAIGEEGRPVSDDLLPVHSARDFVAIDPNLNGGDG